MDQSTKQALLEKLAKASTTSDPVAIKHKGKQIATVLPIEDHQKFQTARNQEIQNLKLELNNFLLRVESNNHRRI